MSKNFTKEGIEVKPGQVWLDLDKRMNMRRVRVKRIVDGKAICWVLVNGLNGRETKLSIHRMHKNSTGWHLVQEA